MDREGEGRRYEWTDRVGNELTNESTHGGVIW